MLPQHIDQLPLNVRSPILINHLDVTVKPVGLILIPGPVKNRF
jgi:hypothetical protein